ncbi:MAG: alanine--tRNA ligase [Phycisphaerae bacterium]|nr:alanine--tRNA ligase [Phycisphaerae bacterium]
MNWTSKKIRSAFIEYFQKQDHAFVASWPVVPIGDETLLFTNAGMNQFKDYFLGLQAAPWKRAVNSQKCIRVSGKHNDLEEVGLDTYHHTFFEMLGNWSFNDYFKAEAIAWAWELLTKVYGIDPDRLWASVFAGDSADGSHRDDEAAELWTKLTPLPKDRVLAFGKKDNFWEMGASGPCGPCSEIHIDLGPDRCDRKNEKGHVCRVNGGCARFMELWNLVFIQFNRRPDGILEKLPARFVDTGAGLERIASVLQGKTSNYDTDLFSSIIRKTEELTGKRYNSQLGNTTDNAFRVIADHIRSLSFSIADGVTPSNEGRGYVIRRVLRRASRFGRVLEIHEPFLCKLVPALTAEMGQAFPELAKRSEFVASVIESEEAAFGRTLDRGLEIFSMAAAGAQKTPDKTLRGEDAFQLYDTFGFPLDLTELLARERGLKVDIAAFEELMDQQRQRARAAQKGTSLKESLSGVELPATDDSLKYQVDRCPATVLGWIDEQGYHTSGTLPCGKEAAIVLDRTCFYAESGGQTGDRGVIQDEKRLFRFEVDSTDKIAECVIHRGRLTLGTLQVGQSVEAIVDPARQETRKNHTATHLLQWALQKVLGDSVHQQGSLVGPEYLRFDFTWPKALTTEQTAKIELLIRERISAALPIASVVLPIEEAKQLGAMALFNEKYGDHVRVIAIGAEDESCLNEAFSREFCGGTHVDNTRRIEGFKILREESVSAGVRRITALTGHALTEHLLERGRIVDDLVELLKVPAAQITARVTKLLEDNKDLAKQLKTAGRKGSTDVMTEADALLKSAPKINETAVVVGLLPAAPIEQIRSAVDSVKKKAGSAAIVFGVNEGEGKVTLIAAMTDDVVAKGLKAGDLVKEVAPIVGGGGGGRPQMAQAGGKDPAKLPEAMDRAVTFIQAKLG